MGAPLGRRPSTGHDQGRWSLLQAANVLDLPIRAVRAAYASTGTRYSPETGEPQTYPLFGVGGVHEDDLLALRVAAVIYRLHEGISMVWPGLDELGHDRLVREAVEHARQAWRNPNPRMSLMLTGRGAQRAETPQEQVSLVQSTPDSYMVLDIGAWASELANKIGRRTHLGVI